MRPLKECAAGPVLGIREEHQRLSDPPAGKTIGNSWIPPASLSLNHQPVSLHQEKNRPPRPGWRERYDFSSSHLDLQGPRFMANHTCTPGRYPNRL